MTEEWEATATTVAALVAVAERARIATHEMTILAGERNELMRTLRSQGASLRNIAEAAGMSHTNVATITAGVK